jgi:hypothetical protein
MDRLRTIRRLNGTGPQVVPAFPHGSERTDGRSWRSSAALHHFFVSGFLAPNQEALPDVDRLEMTQQGEKPCDRRH